MQSSTESFWSEIKTYEERLKQNPASYCFAPLVEVYLRAGLLDDALATARAGVKKHPGFVAGQMALARTCHQKGLFDECRQSLEVVTGAVPEHAEAQRLLSRLYAESGREQEAVKALQTLLDFCPGDMSAKVELESLQRRVTERPVEDDLELIEFTEADIVEEPDQQAVEEDYLVERVRPAARMIEDPWSGIVPVAETPVPVPEPAAAELESVWSVPEQQLATATAEQSDQDPLTTPTMAELYVSQGFNDKALEIYRKIVANNPLNQEAIARLTELEQQLSSFEAGQAAVAAVEQVPASAGLPVQGVADKPEAVAILEGWLQNIRRLRTCH